MLMIPGWEKSEGAIIEKQLAAVYGLTVYYASDGIPEVI
jgi:hypothetical protein